LVHDAKAIGDAPHLDDPAIDHTSSFNLGKTSDSVRSRLAHELAGVSNGDVHVMDDPVAIQKLMDVLDSDIQPAGLLFHLCPQRFKRALLQRGIPIEKRVEQLKTFANYYFIDELPMHGGRACAHTGGCCHGSSTAHISAPVMGSTTRKCPARSGPSEAHSGTYERRPSLNSADQRTSACGSDIAARRASAPRCQPIDHLMTDPPVRVRHSRDQLVGRVHGLCPLASGGPCGALALEPWIVVLDDRDALDRPDADGVRLVLRRKVGHVPMLPPPPLDIARLCARRSV